MSYNQLLNLINPIQGYQDGGEVNPWEEYWENWILNQSPDLDDLNSLYSQEGVYGYEGFNPSYHFNMDVTNDGVIDTDDYQQADEGLANYIFEYVSRLQEEYSNVYGGGASAYGNISPPIDMSDPDNYLEALYSLSEQFMDTEYYNPQLHPFLDADGDGIINNDDLPVALVN